MAKKRLRPPREPGPEECCGSGCTRCVWDVYYDELAAYNEMKAAQHSTGGSDNDANDDSEEYEEDEEESNEGEDSENYIGSVVVKYITTQSASPELTESAALTNLQSRFVPIHSVRVVKCSDFTKLSDANSVNALEIKPDSAVSPGPNPGDVVEIFVPNSPHDNSDAVGDLCKRLHVDPDTTCELHRSPFVPEDSFPPWLPLRTPVKIRDLLTYYVDISSCSYLLRPTFFQSLLRIHQNNCSRGGADTVNAPTKASPYVCGTPELLIECASETGGPPIFQAMMNHGKPLCYPSLVDLLDAFPFVKLPLDRLLEISAPLRPRKFSVSNVTCRESDPARDKAMIGFELCLRKVAMERDAYLKMTTTIPSAAKTLAETLNQIAHYRHKVGETPSPLFHGHVSFPLCDFASKANHALNTSTPCQFFLGTSLFGTSTFSQELKKALTTFTRIPQLPAMKVFLVGAGTGIAPLMAAVHELKDMRAGGLPVVPPFHVWYGASTKEELIYHDVLAAAVGQRALESYKYALSRGSVGPLGEQWTVGSPTYVTDLMRSNAALLKESLLNADGKFFACGPTKVLRSVRTFLENVLGDPDDDESMREQRVLFLEEKKQVLFDVWSTVKDF